MSAPRLERSLAASLAALRRPEETELSLVLTDDPEIADLNRRYLGREGPTNVIAFPMQEGGGLVPPHLLGDVVVSLDTAIREADANGLDRAGHLYRLIIHGILHLLGHDHLQDPQAAREMEELTERLVDEAAPWDFLEE